MNPTFHRMRDSGQLDDRPIDKDEIISELKEELAEARRIASKEIDRAIAAEASIARIKRGAHMLDELSTQRAARESVEADFHRAGDEKDMMIKEIIAWGKGLQSRLGVYNNEIQHELDNLYTIVVDVPNDLP